jgi:hypothetical protein
MTTVDNHADSELIAYELALLQFRPDATSEEAVNIGVVAVAPDTRQIGFRITDRYGRIRSLYPDLDGYAFKRLCRALEMKFRVLANQAQLDRQRLEGLQHFSQAGFDIHSITSGAVSPTSNNFGWSSTRFGICHDLQDRVDQVFHEYVGRLESREPRVRKDSEALWKSVIEHPEVREIVPKIVEPKELSAGRFSHMFRGSWMNGRVQVVEAITLDYADPQDMLNRAVHWLGITSTLAEQNEYQMTAVVTDRPPDRAAAELYDEAVSRLQDNRWIRRVIPESRAQELAEIVEQDLQLQH